MKPMKIAILTSSLDMSSLAFPEDGGDRTFARMGKARDGLAPTKPDNNSPLN
ncbi:co-regulatory protein PtrA N-terminal domain-containing protein [Pseudomonas amygdali]|uniref:co-regulatory protein PtrA N-terminal domain-containing protein n=1 Tax=Pseudomonas amygdali TaxID=47877 RepID=UPI000A60FB08|nr:co-regulatory protein PtrA N-terminal domain-containing protein [Pseudomonas amygdali]